MTPELLKTFYKMGVFVLGASLFLLFVVESGSAEHAISLMSAVTGAALIGLVALASWFMNR